MASRRKKKSWCSGRYYTNENIVPMAPAMCRGEGKGGDERPLSGSYLVSACVGFYIRDALQRKQQLYHHHCLNHIQE